VTANCRRVLVTEGISGSGWSSRSGDTDAADAEDDLRTHTDHQRHVLWFFSTRGRSHTGAGSGANDPARCQTGSGDIIEIVHERPAGLGIEEQGDASRYSGGKRGSRLDDACSAK